MEVINRNEVEPFVTKDSSEIREILAPANSSIMNQSLAEAILAPGLGTDEHYHLKAEELYYVLDGRGRMQIDGEEREVEVDMGEHRGLLSDGRRDRLQDRIEIDLGDSNPARDFECLSGRGEQLAKVADLCAAHHH